MSNRTTQTSWSGWLAPSIQFLLHWGWFIALAIILALVTTSLLPDNTTPASYAATLRIQSPQPASFTSNTTTNNVTMNSMLTNNTVTKNAATFYSNIFVSPTTLSLVLPEHKDLQLADLTALVTATPVANTNVIQLTAMGETPQQAATLVNDIYHAIETELQVNRSKLTDKLTTALNAELQQCELDEQTTAQTLQMLTNAGLANSTDYRETSSLDTEQLQRITAINKQLLVLTQPETPGSGIFKLANTTPDITTVVGNAPTQSQRLALSPLIGLIMSLGGIFLVNTFSNKLPLRGKKREIVLPHIIATIPILPKLRDDRIQIFKSLSPCLPLFRNLRYQASEHERPLKLITVTSPKGREGKSTVALGLALAATQSGLRTLLVDANPQRPILHTWFQFPNLTGTLNIVRTLTAGLPGTLPIFRTVEPNLALLPLGNKQELPDVLIEPLPVDGLRPFIALLRNQADIIIVDGPDLLSDANAANLIQLSDMTILVVDAKKSESTAIIEAESLLSTIGISFATILNRAK